MSAYHQMGHNSWNLVSEDALSSFAGLILSPVNDSPTDTAANVKTLVDRRNDLDVVLDPQFYKPRSARGEIGTWAHFGTDFETANLDNSAWWKECCAKLTREALQVGATSICSPAVIPRVYSDEYYDSAVTCADVLQEVAGNAKLSSLMTAIVRLPELAQSGTPRRIASILTKARVNRVYLVLFDDLSPRDQRVDVEALSGAGALIGMLEDAGCRVLVSFTGLDMILWKANGASDVATGKFFNLRRFVPERWDDPQEKGRVVSYWTDPDLITWLREEDVRLLLRLGVIDKNQLGGNPYSEEILTVLDRQQGEAWLKLAWRQYMYWFAHTDGILSRERSLARNMLLRADGKWAEVERSKRMLFERTNNGEWVRAWLNALPL